MCTSHFIQYIVRDSLLAASRTFFGVVDSAPSSFRKPSCVEFDDRHLLDGEMDVLSPAVNREPPGKKAQREIFSRKKLKEKALPLSPCTAPSVG